MYQFLSTEDLVLRLTVADDRPATTNLQGLRLAGPCDFVIPGRSKERSDAAQTLGSIPLPQPKNATAQNGACIRNGASHLSTMTGYATMTASRKRGTIYIGSP
ncbi:MAG: hypothetical protein E5X60_39635 [Mesorhizobium sp.]|nr:MAG: hypothetical protein E5X60_39635 [Mesorhizobium sp.]